MDPTASPVPVAATPETSRSEPSPSAPLADRAEAERIRDLLAAAGVVIGCAILSKGIEYGSPESGLRAYLWMWAIPATLGLLRARKIAPFVGRLGRPEAWAAAFAGAMVTFALADSYDRRVLGNAAVLLELPAPIATLARNCLLVGLFEELAFRGVVLEGMKSCARPAIAHALTVIAFAFVHFRPIEAWPPLVLFGAFFGLLREYGRSLWPCVFGHALVNFWGTVRHFV